MGFFNFLIKLMAKYTGLLSSDMRGKVGGVIFSANKSGTIAKSHRIPVDSKSPKQSAVRSLFAVIAQSWRSQSSANIAAYKALALLFPRIDSLGKTYYLSGYGMFQFLNLNLLLNGEAVLSAPPSISSNDLASTTANIIYEVIEGAVTVITVTLPGPIPANQLLIIQSSGQLSAGVSSPGNWKTIARGDSTWVGGHSIFVAYKSVFGIAPSVGANTFFRLWLLDGLSGFVGAKVIFLATPSL